MVFRVSITYANAQSLAEWSPWSSRFPDKEIPESSSGRKMHENHLLPLPSSTSLHQSRDLNIFPVTLCRPAITNALKGNVIKSCSAPSTAALTGNWAEIGSAGGCDLESWNNTATIEGRCLWWGEQWWRGLWTPWIQRPIRTCSAFMH